MCLLFPRENFTAACTMVREISTSGIYAISGEVEALKHSLARRRGELGSGKVFAVCLIDGLSYAEEAVTSAIHWQLDDIPLIGGSAGDDMQFKSTALIADGEVSSDAAIIILFATDIPFHVFKTDNFIPTDNKLVVTSSDPGPPGRSRVQREKCRRGICVGCRAPAKGPQLVFFRVLPHDRAGRRRALLPVHSEMQ